MVTKGRSEAKIKNEIAKWLTAAGVEWMRSNAGTIIVENPESGAVRAINAAKAGWPDLTGVLPGGRALFVEAKREHGGEVSAAQERVGGKLRRLGALVIVATSVEDVRDAVFAAGYRVERGKLAAPRQHGTDGQEG